MLGVSARWRAYRLRLLTALSALKREDPRRIRLASTWIPMLLGLAAAMPHTAAGATRLIGHTSSITKYSGTPAAGKLYKFMATAGENGNNTAFPLPTNPSAMGGLVSVARDAGNLLDQLTAGTWKGLGNPAGSSGWKYVNRSAPSGGAVKILLIKQSIIKLVAKGTGSMPAPSAANGPIDTVIVADDQQYCAHASSPHSKEVQNRLIRSRDQQPPVACACVPGFDSDGDRLDNCHETNTGVFVSLMDTGTDPDNPDTDRDGINDGDELLGTTGGLNLPALGTNPLRRDILIEFDWFDDALECGPHTHRPQPNALNEVAAAFAAAPVVNPDGSTGIHMILDRGQGGAFNGGNLIADADGVLTGGVNDAEFLALKAANFAANRNGYFHYTIMPHRYATNSDSSGQAELPGDDMIVSLYCANSVDNVAHTIMHELGHNLFLRHGGFEECNYKPNYNSVMNYRYQFPGVDSDCTPPGDGVLDYSIGDRLALDENNLDENVGVCGAPPWDWNGNSVLETGLMFDINPEDMFEFGLCGGNLSVLRDYDDWSNLFFGGVTEADGARLVRREIVDCDNPAPGGN